MSEAAVDHRRAVAERNVEAILDAAERLLERRETPSISAVAAEAGVSRPTVYAHFPDRDRLLTGVVERTVRAWVEETERLDLDSGPADEALRRLIETSWERISRASHIADVAVASLGAQAMRHSHEGGRDPIRRLAERGRREGAFRADVPVEWLVSAAFALIHAAYDEVRGGTLDSPAALDALLRTVPDLFQG